jgi:hypothetical protein
MRRIAAIAVGVLALVGGLVSVPAHGALAPEGIAKWSFGEDPYIAGTYVGPLEFVGSFRVAGKSWTGDVSSTSPTGHYHPPDDTLNGAWRRIPFLLIGRGPLGQIRFRARGCQLWRHVATPLSPLLDGGRTQTYTVSTKIGCAAASIDGGPERAITITVARGLATFDPLQQEGGDFIGGDCNQGSGCLSRYYAVGKFIQS